MRRDLAFVAGAALAGLALAAFQIWYVALPADRAAPIDVCRWTRNLDCYESLHTNGVALLPVLAALAAVFLLACALAGLAAGASPPRSEAWLALARLASFPATGLAVYVLLADLLFAAAEGPPAGGALVRKTSPSAVLIAAISIAMNVHTVVKGRLGVRLRDAGLVPFALLVAASLFGFFLEGAAGAARQVSSLEIRREAEPPAVFWQDFEVAIPRQGAVPLGDPRAAHEVLLFLDPMQEASRALLRDALDLKAPDVLLQVYLRDRALPADGRAILDAAAEGGALPPAEASPLPARHAKAGKLAEYPTAIWKGGRRAGAFALADVLASARAVK